MNKDNILKNILLSRKYKNICTGTINRIIEEEIKKYKKELLVIKSVKNKLHQIHETFLKEKDLKVVDKYINDNEIEEILKLHISTKERMKFYSEFYKRIFEVTEIPKSIIDIGCGFNPFSFFYMNLESNTKYYAYDINKDNISLLNKYFNKNNINGYAELSDILCSIPKYKTDMAFLFKILPLIEQQKNNCVLDILNNINSKYIIITFPTKSVSGKNNGMKNNYSIYFEKLIINRFFILKVIEFENELIYVIKKEVL